MMTTNTMLFAFTEQDISQMESAPIDAYADYVKYNLTGDYSDVQVSTTTTITDKQFKLSYDVTGKDKNGNTVTLSNHLGIQIDKDNDNYWKTPNVKRKDENESH